MKWLEALKMLRHGHNHQDDTNPPPFMYVELNKLDRLIEIAERAEWGDKSDPFVNVCSICGYDQVQFGKDGEHNITCPYSDDWKKIDNLK